jgi:hypothetical protein
MHVGVLVVPQLETSTCSRAPVRPPSCCSNAAPPEVGVAKSCGSSGPGDSRRAASHSPGVAAGLCTYTGHRSSCYYRVHGLAASLASFDVSERTQTLTSYTVYPLHQHKQQHGGETQSSTCTFVTPGFRLCSALRCVMSNAMCGLACRYGARAEARPPKLLKLGRHASCRGLQHESSCLPVVATIYTSYDSCCHGCRSGRGSGGQRKVPPSCDAAGPPPLPLPSTRLSRSCCADTACIYMRAGSDVTCHDASRGCTWSASATVRQETARSSPLQCSSTGSYRASSHTGHPAMRLRTIKKICPSHMIQPYTAASRVTAADTSAAERQGAMHG